MTVQSKPSSENGPTTRSGEARTATLCPNTDQYPAASAGPSPMADGSASARRLVEALTADLRSLLGLHLVYKVHEWMIEGRSWYVYHTLFVDLGCAVTKSIDLVANRIVDLGGTPVPDWLDEPSQPYLMMEPFVSRSAEGMLAASIRAEKEVVHGFEQHMHLARGSDDYLASDALEHLRIKHQRHIKELLVAQRRALSPD